MGLIPIRERRRTQSGDEIFETERTLYINSLHVIKVESVENEVLITMTDSIVEKFPCKTKGAAINFRERMVERINAAEKHMMRKL